MKYYQAKHLWFILPLLLASIGFVFLQVNRTVKPGQSESPIVKIGKNKIQVDLASTREEQTQGLSDRPYICDDCGMLFIFPEKQIRSFWMKNMLFPLDIIWIDGERIVKIHKNLPPEDENPSTSYSSNVPVDYVLELNAGYCDENGIKEGDKIEKWL